jgi:hypothetical protein
MGETEMAGLKLRRLVAGPLIGAAMILMPLAARATPCDPDIFSPVPDCEVQVQTPVQFDAGYAGGWAFYCTGDHPYFWGLGNANLPGNFTWNSWWFTVTESVFAEGPPNKFDALITNWNIGSAENIIVSLGCSKDPPPNYFPNCPTTGGPEADPGCPQANIHNFCSSGPVPVCLQTYTETCPDKAQYVCSADLGLTSCQQCQ